MFKRLFSAAIVFGAAALAPPVWAQGAACMPREALIETLQARYGESLTGGGLQNPRQVIEVWSSVDSGSFTVFVTTAEGLSCVIASGMNWHSVAALAPPDGVAG